MYWIIEPFTKYVTFGGRARRKEFWYFALFNAAMLIVLMQVDRSSGNAIVIYEMGMLTTIYYLAILLPSLAVAVRRLHDTNRSGWWILLLPIPVVNLVLLYFYILDGDPMQNDYGPSPKFQESLDKQYNTH